MQFLPKHYRELLCDIKNINKKQEKYCSLQIRIPITFRFPFFGSLDQESSNLLDDDDYNTIFFSR